MSASRREAAPSHRLRSRGLSVIGHHCHPGCPLEGRAEGLPRFFEQEVGRAGAVQELLAEARRLAQIGRDLTDVRENVAWMNTPRGALLVVLAQHVIGAGVTPVEAEMP